MGVVYKAYQAAVDRDCAIKVLMPEMIQDETLIKRFELEARAASRLHHPNTITVYDFGREGELLYIAMELLVGESVETTLRRDGAFAPERVAGIVSQVLGSLGEAHTMGIVHRDIKPDNIFLQSIDRQKDFIKVLDFGVAKLKDRGVQDVTLTQAGIIFGTPKYMSPEQAKAKKLDGRSDLYSLGVVMWEMLMGDVPFRAEDPVSILIQHVHDPPPYFRDTRPDLQIPEDLEHITRRALEKDRENRFANADEMRDAIDEYVANAKAGIYGTAAQRMAQTDGQAVYSSMQGVQQQPGPNPTVPPAATPTPGGQYSGASSQPPLQTSGGYSGSMGPQVGSGPQEFDPASVPPGAAKDTWAVDGNQFDLADAAATRMVNVRGSGSSSGLLAAVFILGLLLLFGVGFLIFKISGSAVTDNDDVGVEADMGAGEDAAIPEEDVGTEEDAYVVPPLEDTGSTDDEPTVEDDAGTRDEQLALADTAADEPTVEEDTVVVVQERWVSVRFELSQPDRGVRFDFNDRTFQTDEGNNDIYLFNLDDGPIVNVRARASGYRSASYEIDLSQADENGFVEQTVRLRERVSNTDPCVDPVTGFRDPYCQP